MKEWNANIRNWWSKALNLSVLKKNRWPWVDYLKGIAIILVVYRHILIGIERSGLHIPDYLVNANMIFYSFRMPLFFILSGLFITNSLGKRSLKKIISIKFENLLYPYLIWSFLQITLQIISSKFTNANRTLIDYTYIFYQPRQLDQFWYLAALFNCTIVFLFIKTKLRPPVWLHCIIAIGFYFLGPHLEHISMLSDWMEHYLFFVLGDMLAKVFFRESTQQFLKKWWLLPALVPFFHFCQCILSEPYGKPACVLAHCPYWMHDHVCTRFQDAVLEYTDWFKGAWVSLAVHLCHARDSGRSSQNIIDRISGHNQCICVAAIRYFFQRSDLGHDIQSVHLRKGRIVPVFFPEKACRAGGKTIGARASKGCFPYKTGIKYCKRYKY